MAQRTTITVPDELFKRLQKVKKDFNLSGICQKAIEREIYRQELTKRDQTMQTAIERLRAEKDQHDQRYERDGFTEGCKDAKQEISYDEFLNLFAKAKECAKVQRSRHRDSTQDKLSGHDFCSVVQASMLWKWLGKYVAELKKSNSDFNEDKYLEGWFKGVESVWEKIRPKL
jgi:post-segregation antitoxin (ccd killing protein)